MGSGILMKVLFCGSKSFGLSREEAVEGHVWVYVGRDLQSKFEMEAIYLNHPFFGSLLRTYSEEDLEYSYNEGALRIPCEVGLFRYLVHLLKTSNPSAHYMELSNRLKVSCRKIVQI